MEIVHNSIPAILETLKNVATVAACIGVILLPMILIICERGKVHPTR
jgi:hypothetical protein